MRGVFRILRQALVVFLQLCGGVGSPIFSTANSPEPYLLLNKDPVFNLLDFLEEKLWSSESWAFFHLGNEGKLFKNRDR